MTPDLHKLADAISTQSPAIRAFAEAVASILQPAAWSVAAPGSTGGMTTTVTSQALPVNVYQAPATLADNIVNGSADSAVIVQPKAFGTALRRFHIDPCCNFPPIDSRGRHGVYMKALNVVVEDFYVRGTAGAPYEGQAFSGRMAGGQIRRFDVAGFPHVGAFFQETDTGVPGDHITKGTFVVEQGRGSFTDPSTAWWIDGCEQDMVWSDHHVSGPPSAAFLRVNLAAWAGTARVDGCTINGRPVTAADCPNVPNLTIV